MPIPNDIQALKERVAILESQLIKTATQTQEALEKVNQSEQKSHAAINRTTSNLVQVADTKVSLASVSSSIEQIEEQATSTGNAALLASIAAIQADIATAESDIVSLQGQISEIASPIHLGSVTAFPSVSSYKVVHYIPLDREFYWDAFRNKWLSVQEFQYGASRSGTTTNYLRWFNGSTIDTNSGIYIHSSMVITFVGMAWDEGHLRSGRFQIFEDNGGNANAIYTHNFPSSNFFSVGGLNVPIVAAPNKRIYFLFSNLSAGMPTPRFDLLARFWGDPS